MFPGFRLFGVESLPFVSMYGLNIALGIAAAFALFFYLCKRTKTPGQVYGFYWLILTVSIGFGFLGAWGFQQIYRVVEFFVEYGTLSGFVIGGGLTFMGGLVLGAATFIIGSILFAKPYARRHFFHAGSLAAPCLFIALSFGRMGCFMVACSFGIPNPPFFGIIFPHIPYGMLGMDPSYRYTPLLPTQLIESIFAAILVAIMITNIFRFKQAKYNFSIGGMGYAVFRFLIEYVRYDNRHQIEGTLSPSQWQSIFLFAVSLALVVYIAVFKRIPLYGKIGKQITNYSLQCTNNDELRITNYELLSDNCNADMGVANNAVGAGIDRPPSTTQAIENTNPNYNIQPHQSTQSPTTHNSPIPQPPKKPPITTAIVSKWLFFGGLIGFGILGIVALILILVPATFTVPVIFLLQYAFFCLLVMIASQPPSKTFTRQFHYVPYTDTKSIMSRAWAKIRKKKIES